LCIELANLGASKVIGIDLEEKLLNFANINLQQNYKNYQSIIDFQKKDLLNTNFENKFDFIVTKDTFEHSLNLPEILNKFYEILEKGGKVYAGFGPLYNFYNGDHGRTQLKLPWMHVILPDKFIVNRYNKKNENKINKIEDLGLSKYSFSDYKKIIDESDFKIKYFKTNLSDHPISFIFNALRRIKFLKEFCTYNIYCILEK
jgi:SAM-dependent methyltransferase